MSNLVSSWQFWAILSAILAAATAIFAKVGVEDVAPDGAAFLRTVVVLIVLTLFLFVGGQYDSIRDVPRKSLIFLCLSGVAASLSWIFYFRALKLGPASKVAPIDKMSVVMVAVFSAVFLSEKLSMVNWVGICLIIVGAIFVSSK